MADDRTDFERVNLFVRRAEELLDTRLAASGGLNVGFGLKFGIGQPVSLNFRHPDEEELRSFLLTFRLFVMKDEPTYLYGMHNLCYRLIESDEIRQHLADARRDWHNANSVGSFRFEADGVSHPPDEVLRIWLYGHYFHSDSRYEAELNRLDPLGKRFLRHVMLDLIIDTTNYIVDLARVIVFARREGLLH